MHAVVCTATFATEKVSALWDEIRPLTAAHHAETSFYKDLPLAPDKDRYLMMEERGFLRCYTARDADTKRLVGYSIVIVAVNAHHATSPPMASGDILFLDPEYRGVGLGRMLVNYGDDQLKAEGVEIVFHHGKHQGNFINTLVRCGYQPCELLYTKRLA